MNGKKLRTLKKKNKAALKFNAYLTSVKGGYFNFACPLIVILCDYSYYFAEIFVHLLQTVKDWVSSILSASSLIIIFSDKYRLPG